MMKIQGAKEKAQGIYYVIESLENPIGEGGMGRVYAGMQVNVNTNAQRPVAIKCIFDDLPERVIERARREANIHIRHDNVIEMLGYVETEETRFDGEVIKHGHVVSELLMGVSLADMLSGKTTDNSGKEVEFAKELLQMYNENREEFARKVCVQLLSGLMAIHDAKYIHRDIDPTNIMITHSRHIKVLDLGIAKNLSDRKETEHGLTTAGKFMGKAEYAAPELAIGDLQHQDFCTDIYAVGILLYQLVVGKVPFEGPNCDVLEKQIHEKLPLSEVKDRTLRRIIAKACDKKQSRRYQTCAEMRVDLERKVTPSKITDMTESVSASVSSVKFNPKYIIAAAAVVVLALIGIFIAQNVGSDTNDDPIDEPSGTVQHVNRSKGTSSVSDTDNDEAILQEIAEGEKLAKEAADRGKTDEEGYVEDLISARNQYCDLNEKVKGLKSTTHQGFDAEIADIDKCLLAALDNTKKKINDLRNMGADEAVAEQEARVKNIENAMSRK